ncbi:MAG: pyridoxal-dependent decarboxylase [Bacteroidales bacterium]|nr:pyridoxal-dependent decarboxylase [Bacteroidales bacterium]MCF0190038.1 pyridoxal-dependent decarboxylase [Marinilabiliaceae bacterium]
MRIDKYMIEKLRVEYGDAFYLLDSEQFQNNFKELKRAFSKIYPNFNIAYSYKTNYTPKFCRLINEMGGYAEVVSEMELEIARRVGCRAARIIWNGPIKNEKIAEEFMCEGGTINIDNIEELEFIKQVAARHEDKMLTVGIRCNYEVGDGVVSRFGFDTESEDFVQAVRFATTTKNVKLINFQAHFAKRQIEYWPTRAKGMVALIDRLGIIPERIDIGGGLFGKMADSLKAQFTNEIPDYDAYAQAAATIFADYFKEKYKKPELVIEPGSAIVGDCMKFVGTVKNIKNVRGKYIATVLGSQKNISMSGVNPPIDIIAMGGVQKDYENLDFVGFTCIEGDVLYHNYNGMLAHEDAIVISNCGSYSLVMKPPFILPNFPVLDICEAKPQVIKRGETFDDLFQTYNF